MVKREIQKISQKLKVQPLTMSKDKLKIKEKDYENE